MNINYRRIPRQPSGVTSPSLTLRHRITYIWPLLRVFHPFLVPTWRTLPCKTQTGRGTSWTLAALTGRSSLPTATRLEYNGDNVYFAELMQSQLRSDGKGFGIFAQNGTVSDLDEPAIPSMAGLSEGSLLKYVDRG